MAVRTEPQVRKFGPLESAESETLLRNRIDTRLPLVSDQDRPSVAPLVDGGSNIVPAEVNRGNLPPRVDRKG